MSVQDNVWAAEGDAAVANGVVEPGASVEGGELPSVIELLIELWNDIKADWVQYALVSVGYALVLFPLTIGLVVVMFAGFVPGLVIEDELVMILGFLVTYILAIFGSFVVQGPIMASVVRALWHHEVDGEEMGIGSPFNRMFANLPSVVAVLLITMVLTFAGALFCYVPAFLVGIATVFALPAAAVHGLGPIDAIRLSARHAIQHFGWHAALWGLAFAIMLVLMYVPLVGTFAGAIFYYAYIVRAYRRVFGDGEVPFGWE